MKRIILLHLVVLAFPVLANDVVPPSFEERVAQAKSATDDERFQPYPEQMSRKAGRHVARTMRRCHISSSRDAKPFVLVADIQADGRPRNVEVKPAHAAARCFAAGFSATRYLPPPAYPGHAGFPVMMRVGHAP